MLQGYLVYYSDANCSGSALTGLDAPWFGPNKLSMDMRFNERTVILSRVGKIYGSPALLPSLNATGR